MNLEKCKLDEKHILQLIGRRWLSGAEVVMLQAACSKLLLGPDGVVADLRAEAAEVKERLAVLGSPTHGIGVLMRQNIAWLENRARQYEQAARVAGYEWPMKEAR